MYFSVFTSSGEHQRKFLLPVLDDVISMEAINNRAELDLFEVVQTSIRSSSSSTSTGVASQSFDEEVESSKAARRRCIDAIRDSQGDTPDQLQLLLELGEELQAELHDNSGRFLNDMTNAAISPREGVEILGSNLLRVLRISSHATYAHHNGSEATAARCKALALQVIQDRVEMTASGRSDLSTLLRAGYAD